MDKNPKEWLGFAKTRQPASCGAERGIFRFMVPKSMAGPPFPWQPYGIDDSLS